MLFADILEELPHLIGGEGLEQAGKGEWSAICDAGASAFCDSRAGGDVGRGGGRGGHVVVRRLLRGLALAGGHVGGCGCGGSVVEGVYR